MTQKRDLEYFMANPHEMPGNLDELEAAVMETQPGEDGGEVVAGEQGEKSAASGAPVNEKVEGETGKTAEGEPAAQVIKSKNGKHEIPYSVLETQRARAQAAEEAVGQLQAQIDALTAKVEGKPQAEVPGETDDAELSEEDLADIASDFPVQGKAIKALLSKVTSLTQRLDEVAQREGARAGREATSASQTVQEAIEANPQLTYWQTKDPEMFGVAVKYDNQIKSDPRNAGLSLDERFAKVVKVMEAVYGETELPDEFRRTAPAATTNTAAKPASKPQQTAAARAQQVIQEAQAFGRVGSLSDIPGGVPPASDELTQLAELSAHDLGNKLMSMDTSKVMALLARAA